MNEWINVDEALPPKWEDVLVYTDKGQIKISCYQGEPQPDSKGRHEYWKWWGNKTPTVLYWMPLPERP